MLKVKFLVSILKTFSYLNTNLRFNFPLKKLVSIRLVSLSISLFIPFRLRERRISLSVAFKIDPVIFSDTIFAKKNLTIFSFLPWLFVSVDFGSIEKVKPEINFLEENANVCEKFNNETIEALKQIPPNYLDVVFTSGKDSKVANFINGYPVLQNFANGTDFSWVKLTYDHKQKAVVKERTQILQPVRTCHQFFRETEDCYTKEVLRNVEIKKAKFLNNKIKIDPIPIHK